MGRRVKAKARPFLPGMEKELNREFDCLEAIIKLWDDYPDLLKEILDILASSKDPYHAINLLDEKRPLPPAELFILSHLCFCVSRLGYIFKSTGVSRWPQKAVPPSLEELEKHLAPGSQGQPTFYVSDAYSKTLAELRQTRKHKQSMRQKQMDKHARKVENVLGRRFGTREEIAIRKANYTHVEKARSMPELSETRETLTHVFFRLKPTRNAALLEREINGLRQKERTLEQEVLLELSLKAQKYISDIKAAARAVGELDFLISKAELARPIKATRPQIISRSHKAGGYDTCLKRHNNSEPGLGPLVLYKAYHPVVLKQVEFRSGSYQPISIDIDSTVSVITGPNMGGKTVALATVGLCVAMAQWGLMVPCRHMQFGLYDFIHFQCQEGHVPGLSSFALEIVSLKEPLSRIGEKGLVLLDEVGRGTNPSQGLALYAALLSYYLENGRAGSTVIATTHYHGLADMLNVPHWQIRGLAPELKDPEGVRSTLANGKDGIDWLYGHMDYTLQKVGPDTETPQDALLVAKMLGLNEQIVSRAQDFHDAHDAHGAHGAEDPGDAEVPSDAADANTVSK